MMKIINKTKGYIYYSTGGAGFGDCGYIAENKDQYLPYQDVPVRVNISFQQPSSPAAADAEATATADAAALVYYQTFEASGSDEIQVAINVSS